MPGEHKISCRCRKHSDKSGITGNNGSNGNADGNGDVMGRLHKFREIRVLRQKYFFSIFIFLTILSMGLCIADYSVNSLIGVQKGLKFFSMRNYESYLEVIFMNQKLDIDTEYINRDLKRLRAQAERIIGGKRVSP